MEKKSAVKKKVAAKKPVTKKLDKSSTEQAPEQGRRDVDAYLAALPEASRVTLEKVRAIIRAAAPKEATERISYRIPAFFYKGPLIYYAAFTSHCSLFPMQQQLFETHGKELAGMETSKGTLRFPISKPPSKALIQGFVKLRREQNEALVKAKKRS